MASNGGKLRKWWPIMTLPLGVSIAVLAISAWSHFTVERGVRVVDLRREIADDETLRKQSINTLAKRLLLKPDVILNSKSQEPKASEPTKEPETTGTTSDDAKPQSREPYEVATAMVETTGLRAASRVVATQTYDAVESAISEQAKLAHVVIELDRVMQVGSDYTASLIVQGGLAKDVASLTQSTLEPIVAELDVIIAPDAEAFASSSQFDISSITPSKQAIRAQAPTVWQWTLTPRRDGEAALMIMLRQNVIIDGETYSFPVKQFPQIVSVKLTWWLWAREAVSSFWGVVMAILVAGASAATIYSAVKPGGRDAETKPTRNRSRKVAG